MSAAIPRFRDSARLRVASCMADNAARFARAVGEHVGRQIGMAVEFVDDVAWRERERQLYAGGIQLCWICGLPYVQEAARSQPRIELLAAPIMAAARYGGQPVYFSDVVVRAERDARSLADLRGLRIAYNEPNSHSGFAVLRHALASMQAQSGFFAEVVESGAHQRSIELVLAGLTDAAVIDSTVLETELEARPQLRSRLRAIETLGPSSMPPWVIHRDVPDRIKAEVLDALLAMDRGDSAGRDILHQSRVARFARVTDAWYDPIRAMAASGATHALSATHRAIATAGGLELCPA